MSSLYISIIMPNYNGEKYLKKAIDSFLIQDYTSKELIIIDGKSTDKSHEILEYYSNNPQIKWIKYKDNGISDAINHGLAYTCGEIIGYLGSDDLINNGLFELINNQSKLIDFDAVYFNSYTYYIDKRKINLRRCPNIEFTKSNLLKFGTIVGLQNIFFKRHVYEKFKFNISNKYSMDYEFYLQISDSGYLFLYVDKVATINLFDNNITYRKNYIQQKEALKTALAFSNNYFFYFFIKYKEVRCRVIMALTTFLNALKASI